jgi:hypothetical protein
MVDLADAGARLREFRPEATPDVSEIVRRRDRHRRRRITVGIVAAGCVASAAALVAVTSSGGAAVQHVRTGPASTAPSPTPITAAPGHAIVTIRLDRTKVAAGTVIHGVATVDNRTGAKIPVIQPFCSSRLTVNVGLANDRLSVTPNAAGSACLPPFMIPLGLSQYPITIHTTYNACTNTPSETTYSLPACGAPVGFGAAPMPPGVYHTVIEPLASSIAVATTIAVTLTPATIS